jgi:ferritin-like protein
LNALCHLNRIPLAPHAALRGGLEQDAVSAHLGAVPLFGDRDLAKAAASILGEEAMHSAILRQALGENPIPEPFVLRARPRYRSSRARSGGAPVRAQTHHEGHYQ